MDAHALSRYTFRNELCRAVPNGILDTLYSTFAMLVAIQWFHSSDLQKSLISSLPSVGLILSLLILPRLRDTGLPLAQLSAGFYFLGAFALSGPFLFDSAWGWTACISLASVLFSLQVPLITQIYRFNYPDHKRGRLFSITGMLRSAAAIPFGLALGTFLKQDISRYHWVTATLTAAAVLSGLLFLRLPTPPIPKSEGERRRWSSAFQHVRDDKDFRTLLTSWMIMGTGSIAAASLFVEHLANPGRSETPLSPEQIAIVTTAIPILSRLCFGYFWGCLFDRLNIFAFRSILNLITCIAILLFFWSDGPHAQFIASICQALGYDIPLNMAAACAAMILWGMSIAGGNIAWVLWVTRLAPPDRVAEYQSVHTFLTGIRGAIAPFLGFWLIARIPAFWVGFICSTLAILSILPAWSRVFSKDQRLREARVANNT